MFGKKEPAIIKTLIAQGTCIQGGLKFQDGLRVDGEVYGPIQATSAGGTLLVISEGAIVEGGIKADHVIVNGTVKGPIEARELIELQSRARIEGEVQYAAVTMEHGATILGQLRPMGMEAAPAEEDKPLIRLAKSA